MKGINIKDKERIEKIAKMVKANFTSKYKVTDFKNPYDVISKMEDYIIIRAVNNNGIQGFTLKKGNYRCIYINSADILARQYYSCWHEFYHSIDDRIDENQGIILSMKKDKSKIEQEAEYFASCMLLDRIELEDFIRINWDSEQNLTERDLIRIQYHFNVSYECLKLKLKEIFNNNKFFTFTINSIERRADFEEAIISLGYNLDLVTETNDFCVPKLFMESLKQNIIDKRIGMAKANDIIAFLKDNEVSIKW